MSSPTPHPEICRVAQTRPRAKLWDLERKQRFPGKCAQNSTHKCSFLRAFQCTDPRVLTFRSQNRDAKLLAQTPMPGPNGHPEGQRRVSPASRKGPHGQLSRHARFFGGPQNVRSSPLPFNLRSPASSLKPFPGNHLPRLSTPPYSARISGFSAHLVPHTERQRRLLATTQKSPLFGRRRRHTTLSQSARSPDSVWFFSPYGQP